MARSARWAVLAVAALAVGLGATACDEDDWPVQGEGAPGIDESINGEVLAFLAEHDLPGATVAVTRGGRLVWSKAYGWADEGEQIRMKPWHRSRIGSVSKVITAIGLLQMLESDGPTLGSLALGPSDLQSKLSQKLYGHPGDDVDSASWPSVVEPTVLADPELYWEAMRDGVTELNPDTFDASMATMIDWASQVELGHLLSHTSGLVRSGPRALAAEYFGIDEADVTYAQVHQAVLAGQTVSAENSSNVKCWVDGALYVDEEDEEFTGQTYQLPPFLFEPGTDECYSNHGFGLLGYIMDELSGPGEENTYRGIIEQGILEPLGLSGVVPNNADISELDAWPHGSELDPETPSTLGLPTGGWTASAQDMVRIMCGLDRQSNHLRLLSAETVTTMESIAYPDASSSQPLGWDKRYEHALTKNGKVGGGTSLIIKYLPGRFDAAPDDEINIAMNVNSGAEVPTIDLLRSIAGTVAEADIDDDYDLFDPQYACTVEPGLVAPTISPSPVDDPTLVNPTVVPSPSDGATFVAPTRSPEPPPSGPTVAIRAPLAGQHTAPSGVASLTFSGLARDASGAIIPGTQYRWTAVQGTNRTVLCAGSGIGPGPSATPSPSPTGIGGLTTPKDCTSFTGRLTQRAIGAGPPITILLEARDPSGTIGNATVVITLYHPPVG